MRPMGFTGGLKGIEKQFGICRSEPIDGLSGYDAVLLWRKYVKGNQQALDTLVEYNTCDTRNLKYLMDKSYKIMFEKIFPHDGTPVSILQEDSAPQENSSNTA